MPTRFLNFSGASAKGSYKIGAVAGLGGGKWLDDDVEFVGQLLPGDWQMSGAMASRREIGGPPPLGERHRACPCWRNRRRGRRSLVFRSGR